VNADGGDPPWQASRHRHAPPDEPTPDWLRMFPNAWPALF
jgi:hypothetical protein